MTATYIPSPKRDDEEPTGFTIRVIREEMEFNILTELVADLRMQAEAYDEAGDKHARNVLLTYAKDLKVRLSKIGASA